MCACVCKYVCMYAYVKYVGVSVHVCECVHAYEHVCACSKYTIQWTAEWTTEWTTEWNTILLKKIMHIQSSVM